MMERAQVSNQQEESLRRRNDILTWLSSYDYIGVQEAMANTIHPNTCRWILDTSEFRAWNLPRRSILWMRGRSGSGKTIATASIIRHLQQKNSGRALAYMYCSSNDVTTQTNLDIIATILRQLVASASHMPDEIQAYYDKCLRGSTEHHKPKVSDFETWMHSLISRSVRNGIDIVLDGVNETQEPVALTEWALGLHRTFPNIIRLFFTSTYFPDIESNLYNALQLHLDGSRHRLDIEQYIDDRLMSMPKFRSLNESFRLRVSSSLKQKSQGM